MNWKNQEEKEEDKIKWSNQMKNVNTKIHSIFDHFILSNWMKWNDVMKWMSKIKKDDKMTKEKKCCFNENEICFSNLLYFYLRLFNLKYIKNCCWINWFNINW